MRFKHSFFAVMVAALAIFGCAKTSEVDDLSSRVDDLELKVDKIQKQLNDLNADVTAIKLITDAIKANGYVQDVKANDEGVLVTVVKGGQTSSVSIKIDGKQGEPGASSVVSVVEEGGVLYWAVNGVSTGKTVYEPAPQFKVNDNKIQVSYDEGKTWTDIPGEIVTNYIKPAFTAVDVKDEVVVFTTTGGATFELPLEKAFGLKFESLEVVPEPGSTTPIAYTVVAASEETVVDVLATTEGFTAEVVPTDATKGVVNVTAPAVMNKGYVLVWADNQKGKTSIKKITLASASIAEVSSVAVAGGELEVAAVVNVPIAVKVDDAADWIHYVTTKTVETKTIVLDIDENFSGESRTGEVYVVRADDPTVVVNTIEIVQLAYDAKVILNGKGYETIQAAIDAAADKDVINIAKGTFDEHLQIKEKAVTIQGVGAETVVNSVEIYKAAATVKDLTITPAKKKYEISENGSYTNYPYVAETSDGYKYPFGLLVHRAGYGVTVENVTIEMEGVSNNTTAMFWLNDDSERGEIRDEFVNNTVNGIEGQRNGQIYTAFLNIENNVFKSSYSYSLRIGENGNDVILKDNNFTNAKSGAVAVQFTSQEGSTIAVSGNTQDGSFDKFFTYENEWFTVINKVSGVILGRAVLGKTSEYLQKTNGFLTRAWANITTSPISESWDSFSTLAEWDRNAVLTAKYIYMPIGKGGTNYGVAVINRKTGAWEYTIKDGIETTDCTWPTCGSAKLKDGDGEMVLVSNLSSGKTLKIYKLTEASESGYYTKAEKVFEYAHSGIRVGDKMTTWGSTTKGNAYFVPYADPTDHQRGVRFFRCADGTFGSEPIGALWLNVDEPGAGGNTNHMNGLYPFAGDVHEFMYCGTQNTRLFNSWNWDGDPGVTYYSTKKLSQVFSEKDQALYFENIVLDPRFFTVDGTQYMVYVSVVNKETKATGYLRVVKLPAGDEMQDRFETIGDNLDAYSEKYPLGDLEDINAGGTIATQGTGYCDIKNVDGTWYILAGITGAGMSLFEFN